MDQKKHYDVWLIFIGLLLILVIIFALLYVFQQAKVGTTNALTEPQQTNGWLQIGKAFFHFLKR